MLVHHITLNSAFNKLTYGVQKFAVMVDSIETALNSFHLVACILGFGIYKNNLDYSRFYFSIFYVLTVWSVYIYIFCYIMSYYSPSKIFGGILITLIIMINLFATIISVIITIRDHKVYFYFINILLLYKYFYFILL